MSDMTQNERIIQYLQTHEYITSLQAYHYFGIMRLSARIKDLQAKGYMFTKDTVESHNRYGDVTRFTGYGLIKGTELEGR